MEAIVINFLIAEFIPSSIYWNDLDAIEFQEGRHPKSIFKIVIIEDLAACIVPRVDD